MLKEKWKQLVADPLKKYIEKGNNSNNDDNKFMRIEGKNYWNLKKITNKK
jgi:hypothetical protein